MKKSLGQLQATVWERIKEATQKGDGMALRRLGQIAGEMERKHDDWQTLLDTGGQTANGAASGPVLPTTGPGDRQGSNGAKVEDFSGRSIRSFKLAGNTVSVGSYKDLLLGVIKILQEKDPDRFETVAPQIRGRGPYFSENPNDLRLHHQLKKGKLFVETNLNANLIVAISVRLAEAFGETLELDVVPFRSRQRRPTL
jgi:hypothetical protein